MAWEVTPPDIESLSEFEFDAISADLDVAVAKIEAARVALADRVERCGHHLLNGHSTVGAWQMATTNCSPAEAMWTTKTARVLRGLDQVRAEFGEGRVGVAQVRELARVGSNPRCGDRLADSQDVLLEAADALEFVQFRTVVNRWEQLADPDGAHTSHERAHQDRNARLSRVGDEFKLDARFGIIQGAILREVLEPFVRAEFDADRAAVVAEYGDKAPADLMPRTAAQRRADAWVAMAQAAAKTGVGDGQPVEITVNLIADVDTFAQYVANGIADTPVDIDPSTVKDRRCETTDGIAVDPRQVVALAAIGKVRAIIVDEHGIIVTAGHKRRLFTKAQRQAIMAIHPKCYWLGCLLRSQLCDVDHLQPHSRGGPTDMWNGKPGCHHHNIFKSNFRQPPTRPPRAA